MEKPLMLIIRDTYWLRASYIKETAVAASVAVQRFGNDVRKDLFARIMSFSF